MSTIPDWVPAEAWAGYVEMRKKLKKPMTGRAMALRIADLEQFRAAGHDIGAILDQSTANNWTDLYELKERRAAGNDRRALPQLGKHGNATAEQARQWLEQSGMDDSLEQKRKFATLLTHLADYYKAEISRAVLGIYWEGLKQYSYEAIEKACWAHTQLPDEAGRWMPRNADIIKMIAGSTVDQAAVAWSVVDSAIRVRGTWDDVVFDDPIIHRVIADMGGWVKIGSHDDDAWPFIGKEFQTRYRSFRMRGEMPDYPKKLTGMANAHNAAGGRPLLPPILLGNPEKAKLVLKGQLSQMLLGND
jgi:hypothetical protein